MNVLKYPGSKQQCANWIIGQFPSGYKRMTYLEPFFGSGCVFFAKERSVIETINDIDSGVINLFRQIREHPAELARAVQYTPWSREEYELAFAMDDALDDLEKARRFIVHCWASIGARGAHRTGWRNVIQRNTGNISAFHQQLPDVIVETCNRLSCISNGIVQIEQSDAFMLLEKYNRSNVLIYLDPPYLLETRKNKKIYKNELSFNQHEKLLETIKAMKSYIIISGYDSELYNDVLSGWDKQVKKVTAEQGKSRTECLWKNYRSVQYQLFDGENHAGY